MVKYLVKAKFDSKKAEKNVLRALGDMNSELMGIAVCIDEAEEASPYKVDRISIDAAISSIEKDIENLEKYCSKFLRNLKTEL